MKTHIQDILEIKSVIIEVAKDSPLLAYMAFYEPLHGWLSGMAEGWNPFAKFVLNVVMVIYGVLRIVAIVRGWDKPQQQEHDNEGTPI
jgi:hypothetical protein